MKINSRAKVWGSDMSAKQKIRLYNSCAVSVLLDAAKTWGITQADKKRFDAFDSRCLGGISNVKWHHYVGNIEFQERTRKEKIMDSLTRKWLWCSDHLMSVDGSRRSCELDLLLWASQPMLRFIKSLGKSVEISSRFWCFNLPAKDGKASGVWLYYSHVEDVFSIHWPTGERWGGEKKVNGKM